MIKPLHSHVVLEKLPMESKTLSGIILTTDGTTTFRCVVKAIGPGKKDEDISVLALEDTVLISKFARTTEIASEGKSYVVVPFADIIAVL